MEIVQLPPDALKAPPNMRGLLVGCSQSGKSSFLCEMIKNKEEIFPKPGYDKFIYCSPNLGGATLASPEDNEFQRNLEELAKPSQIIFMDHIITHEELQEETQSLETRCLLLIDDYSHEAFENPLMYQLFTRLSSHARTDCLISIHVSSGASKTAGKWYSLISQNSNFLVIFRNLANRASTGHLSQRIFPRGENFLQQCLDESTNILGCYAYIVVDANLKNPLNVKYSVRSNIFQAHDTPMLLFKNPKMSRSKK